MTDWIILTLDVLRVDSVTFPIYFTISCGVCYSLKASQRSLFNGSRSPKSSRNTFQSPWCPSFQGRQRLCTRSRESDRLSLLSGFLYQAEGCKRSLRLQIMSFENESVVFLVKSKRPLTENQRLLCFCYTIKEGFNLRFHAFKSYSSFYI